MNVDTSRDPNDLHPLLREAWEYLRDDFKRKWPDAPEPKLSATYRGPIDQNRAFANGKSRHQYPESMHNHKPAFAFDIYFEEDRRAIWDWDLFERFAREAERIGLFWGGRWPRLLDGPHFQFKDVTGVHARNGVVPHPPLIPKNGEQWKLVLMLDGRVVHSLPVPADMDVVTRVSQLKKRYYIDVRSSDA